MLVPSGRRSLSVIISDAKSLFDLFTLLLSSGRPWVPGCEICHSITGEAWAVFFPVLTCPFPVYQFYALFSIGRDWVRK